MRLKFVFGFFSLMAVLLMLVWLARPGTSQTPAVASARLPIGSSTGNHKPTGLQLGVPEPSSPTPGTDAGERKPTESWSLESSAETNEAELRARAMELMDLAMNNDSGSLDSIISELRNPNRALRNAALQAVIQFGSRDAIPSLTEAAAQTEDPEEKAEILQAIGFLNLPSLSEVLALSAPVTGKQSAPAATSR